MVGMVAVRKMRTLCGGGGPALAKAALCRSCRSALSPWVRSVQRPLPMFSSLEHRGGFPAVRSSSIGFSTSSVKLQEEEKEECHDFQAETRQLLDIVTNSIYTDKEVCIRELISNASDALEKLRHVQAMGQQPLVVDQSKHKAEIHITTDEAAKTLTISDSGIGMTKQELIENLGTIARSGSKAFMEQMKAEGQTKSSADAVASGSIIGKFGVGFYSAFMIGDHIEVHTRSASTNGIEGGSAGGHVWSSDGTGSYSISASTDDSNSPDVGSKIVIHLKDSCEDFAKAQHIESIIRKYSNFVSYPIFLNGEAVNTIQALWSMDSTNDITEEQYTEFYKYVANAFDEPLFRFSFRADAPIELKTLFFVGTSHMEKHGFARLEPGVSLYSRKVLIERNSKHVLPDWMRFVKGVVDSEDLPLSLSREGSQDSRLVAKIRDVLTRRFVRFLEEQSRKEPEKFTAFYKEFSQFLKEGICSDYTHKDAIAKLLRYETSAVKEGELSSLDEYVARCTPEQESIYYLHAPSRELALNSPYYESFKKKSIEVLFLYGPIDDFVMNTVGMFNKRKLVSAEKASFDEEQKDEEDASNHSSSCDDGDGDGVLSSDAAKSLTSWLQVELDEFVKEVKTTNRLSESPALISDHESASVRRMMHMINESQGGKTMPTSKHVFEVNAKHPIMRQLHVLQSRNPELASLVARQIYDNAALAAGLVDDGRSMVPRLHRLMETLLSNAAGKTPSSSS